MAEGAYQVFRFFAPYSSVKFPLIWLMPCTACLRATARTLSNGTRSEG